MIFPFKMRIAFTVDGPAVPKQRPRMAGRHAYTPKKTRLYEERVRQAFFSSYEGQPYPMFPKDTPVYAYIEIIQPIPKSWSKSRTLQAIAQKLLPITRNGDLDNITKSILDALNTYAYEDDAQVTRIYASKRYGNDPYALVILEEDIRG